MDDNGPDEAFAELKTRDIGGWGVAQIAAGSGLAVYAMWAGILQPGFRKVPLRLQVPYIAASKAQVDHVMTLLKGRKGGLVDLGSGDGRIVDLTECKNVTVFLAPSVLSLLQQKLEAELPDDALMVAGRFPFPDWTPCRIEGHGVDRAWAYSMQAQRRNTFKKNDRQPTGINLNQDLTEDKGST
ncbi:adenine nucleotide translocase lysine N-methyltransferase isoform X2 [Etheostoma cragini]|uniref:adenine nucleotide translocase lysine N-methyltransferase isoform X2 n=1 Tax=Etheostoma cragini TaxID=417921 RepID=UPI00155ED80A|nr:adenine nucleotide translocase lysine N-methyltransferase isoform X2 [Etheostoma cragini]